MYNNLVTQLVTQARKDLRKQERRLQAKKRLHHEQFGLEFRAKLI